MKRQWQMYAARFDALARRERTVVAGALVFGLGMLGYTFLVEPQFSRYATQTKNLAKATTELQVAEAQLVGVQAQLKDPDAPNRNALKQSRKDLEALEAKVRIVEGSLVPPNKMQGFLESLLSKNHNLELIALTTLPPTTLIDRTQEPKAEARAEPAPASPVLSGTPASPTSPAAQTPPAPQAPPAAPPPTGPNIYKHGIEIKIAGNYSDLLMYLVEIERMPQRIIWNRLKLTTEVHPRNEMTLTVYTLSLDTQWLVV